MSIELNSEHAILWPPYKLGHVEWDFLEALCEKLGALGFIQRFTELMYASSIIMVRKGEMGNYIDFHKCGDYRPLNQETTLGRHPLPEIYDIFNQMEEAKTFSKLELKSGHHQMSLHKEGRSRTTF